MGNGCMSNGWSIISSASTNSQLAGVLAGFIFTGVTILLGRKVSSNTRALGLLFAAFVVLAFDSYLFSLVAGGSADPICVRVWSEAMPACGMLAVGGLSVVTGITWMLAGQTSSHEDASSADDRDNSMISLDRLARFMALGVAIAVTLLLAATTADYLRVVYPHHTLPELVWSVGMSPFAVASASIVLLWYRHRNPTSKVTSKISVISLTMASYGVLVYAVLGTVFSGYIDNITAVNWRDSLGFLATSALLFGLYIPSLLLIALVQSIAPLREPNRADTSRQEKPLMFANYVREAFRRRRKTPASEAHVPQNMLSEHDPNSDKEIQENRS